MYGPLTFLEEQGIEYSPSELREIYKVHSEFCNKVPLEIILAMNLIAKKTVEENKDFVEQELCNRWSKNDKKRHLALNGYGVGNEFLIPTFIDKPDITPQRPFALNTLGTGHYLDIFNHISSPTKRTPRALRNIVVEFDSLYDSEPYDGISIEEFKPMARELWDYFEILSLYDPKRKDEVMQNKSFILQPQLF
jgi:hypothetical protein